MNREILRLAVPNILSNISTPLIGCVDIFLVGGLSAAHIGAVGVGSMIFNLIYWNFGFLSMGKTGLTAQAYGRKDNKEIIEAITENVKAAKQIVHQVNQQKENAECCLEAPKPFFEPWKIRSNLGLVENPLIASLKNGKLFLLAPRGHKAFVERILDKHSLLHSKVIYLR